MNQKVVIFLLSMLVASSVVAQRSAPIVELGTKTTSQTAAEKNAALGQSDSYYQMQLLQEEIRQLRGLVEELKYELQQVKQRQMDDYMDIDRRLSALANTTPAITTGNTSVNTPAQKPGLTENKTQTLTEATPEMTADYTKASNLLLKQKDIEGSALAFKKHVVDYPNSPYVPNAWYWLGEIYLLQGQTEDARQAFTIVAEQYADHRKAMDATFKLGKIYHQLGDTARARTLLEKVAGGIGTAAAKAKSYLADNF